MIYGCSINGVHSSTLGIYMLTKSRPILPANNDSYLQVIGKAGSYLNPQQQVDRIEQVEFSVLNPDLPSMKTSNRAIAAWLHSKDRVRIIFDDEPDKYYWGKVDGIVDFQQFDVDGVLSVSFRCQPFAQMVISTGDDPTWEDADFPWAIDMPWVMVDAYRFEVTDTTTFIFDHPGTQEVGQTSPQGSQFNVVIVGTWAAFGLNLNGKAIWNMEAGPGTLIIDNVNMEATLNGESRLDAIGGDLDSFLTVEPGTNTIVVAGTDLNIAVTLGFTPLWL